MAVIVRVTNRRKKYTVLVKRGAGTVVNSNNTYSAHISSGDTLVVPDSNITNSIGTYNVSLPATIALTVPDGSVRNSDNSWIAAVPAADGIIAPDIQVTDSDGSTYSYPSVKDVVCSLPVGSDVTNSDGSYNAHVNNGATLVLPDITATEPDGSTYSYPAAKDITLPDSRNLNVQFLATYDDEITLTATTDEATTWTTESLTNVATIAYEKNSVAASLPITLAASDTLKITITRTNAALDSKVKLTNA